MSSDYLYRDNIVTFSLFMINRGCYKMLNFEIISTIDVSKAGEVDYKKLRLWNQPGTFRGKPSLN